VFEEVFGHEKNKRILERLIERDCVPQRLCFCGPEGIGKQLMATLLARYLLCASGSGCQTCSNCHKMSQGWHPDYTEIQPDGGDIKVEQIRTLVEKLHFRPFEAKRRVIVIDQAQRLRDEAANAFLKALEEPPSYVTYILVTSHWNGLLPTIRSRCQKITFWELRLEDKVDILVNGYGLDREMAQNLAGISFASLETDPQAWDGFQANLRDVAGFFASAFKDPPEIDYLSGKLLDKKNIERFLEHFSQTLREILRLSQGMEPQPIFESIQDELSDLASKASGERWRTAWERTLALKTQRRLNVNHTFWFNDFALNELGLKELAESKLEARLSLLKTRRDRSSTKG